MAILLNLVKISYDNDIDNLTSLKIIMSCKHLKWGNVVWRTNSLNVKCDRTSDLADAK